MNMRSIALCVGCLCLVELPAGALAASKKVHVSASDNKGSVLSGQLWRRTSGKEPAPHLPISMGDATFTEKECVPTTMYRFVPTPASLYVVAGAGEEPDPDEWKVCADDVPFLISRRVFVAAVGTAVVNAIVEDAVISVSLEKNASAYDLILKAYASGDYGAASYLSTEVGEALLKQGRKTEGDAFRQFAWSAAADGLALKLGSDPTQWVVYNKNESMFLPTAAGETAFENYQVSLGILANREVNWPTMKSLSTSPHELGLLREQVLQAIEVN